MQHRDEKTAASRTPCRDLLCGREADLYLGRRLLLKQVALIRGGVLGKRQHRKHWTALYVLDGHIELRLFKEQQDDPFHGVVATPLSEPTIIPARTIYEVTALTDVNLIVVVGNYTNDERATFTDLARLLPDAAPQEV